ncbi:Protein obstructor-E [Nymphon striatum]|nr:Protein obstructor-E [Nymphon striatum]
MSPACINVWVRDLDNYRHFVEKISKFPAQCGKKDPRGNRAEDDDFSKLACLLHHLHNNLSNRSFTIILYQNPFVFLLNLDRSRLFSNGIANNPGSHVDVKDRRIWPFTSDGWLKNNKNEEWSQLDHTEQGPQSTHPTYRWAPPAPRDKVIHIERMNHQEGTGGCNIKCPSSTGMFRHPNDCSKYYTCANGQAYVGSCQYPLLFNEKERKCDWPERVGCPNPPSNFRHICGRPFGLFPHPRDCGAFYNCWGGFPHLQECSPGLMFTASKQRCEWAQLSDCGSGFRDGNIRPMPEPSPGVLVGGSETGQISSQCPSPNGQFPYPNDCERYIVCVNGRPTTARCPDNKLFEVWPLSALASTTLSKRTCSSSSDVAIRTVSSFVLDFPPQTSEIRMKFKTNFLMQKRGFNILVQQKTDCSVGMPAPKYWKKVQIVFQITWNLLGNATADIGLLDSPKSLNSLKIAIIVQFVSNDRNTDNGFHIGFSQLECGDGAITTTRPPRTFKCPSRNGKFVHPERCDMYFECSNFYSFVRACPAGMLVQDPRFGSVGAVCQRADQVSCGARATDRPLEYTCPRPNGQHPKQCNNFYVCNNFFFRLVTCDPGLLFQTDPNSPFREGTCLPVNQVDCFGKTVEGTTVAPDPFGYRCPAPRGLFPHSTDCDKFYNCTNGIPFISFCPQGELFSNFRVGIFETGSCLPAQNVNCGCECINNVPVARFECPEGEIFSNLKEGNLKDKCFKPSAIFRGFKGGASPVLNGKCPSLGNLLISAYCRKQRIDFKCL